MTDIIKEAQERYREALDATADQRKQIREDLEFSDPSNPRQWDEDVKRARECDPGGARPCLVLDQLGQYTSNVAGQVEQRPPALHAIPSTDGDRKVAEHLDGLFRHVEHVSRASQHYARALTSAARTGVGYLIVRPEYTDRALGYQEPRISSEGDPLRVVLDPWSVEIDGSDADWGQLLTPLSHREFERRFGKKAEKIGFGDDEGTSSGDDRKEVLTAEEWRIEDKRRTMVFCRDLTDPEGGLFALPEDEFFAQQQLGRVIATPDDAGRSSYPDTYRCVKWVRLSGAEILTEEREYPADGIAIVPVYGYVGYADGRMAYCGIPRRARQAQQDYNFHKSEQRVHMKNAPRSPWLVPESAMADAKMQALWDRASVDHRAWLPYRDWDPVNGRPIAPPTRAQVSINLQNHLDGAQQALRDIQAAIGMYQANLGAPSNETSGVAIENRKQQGEASTSHFPSHLAASLTQVGKLTLTMLQRLVDTKRQLRILGIDMTPGKVTVDPGQQQPMVEDEETGAISINPKLGTYDVRVVVGASFSTQRQQAQEAYTEMMRANPAMMPAIAPLWAQTLDVPHADKLAQVLTAVAPDPVKAILQPQQQDTTATLKAQIDQLKAALQEAITHAQEAQQEAEEARAQAEDKELEALVKSQELRIKAYEASTKRLTAVPPVTPEQVVALAQQTVAAAMAQPQPMPAGMEETGRSGDLLQQPGVEPPEPRQPMPAFPPLMPEPDPMAQMHEQAEMPPAQAQDMTE
jgi:hypothetical protein